MSGKTQEQANHTDQGANVPRTKRKYTKKNSHGNTSKVVYATNLGGENIPTGSALETESDTPMQQPKIESENSKDSNGELPNSDAIKSILESMDKVKAEMCKRDFFFFIKEFWEAVSPEKPVYNWHIEWLAKELQVMGRRVINREKKEADVIINLPPGQTKSTIISQMFNAWLWCIDPTIKVIAASATDKLVLQNATKTRDIVKSTKYQTYFPAVEIRVDQDVKSYFQTTKGGSRIGTTVGGTIIGFHAHVIICDDLQDVDGVQSELVRNKANEFVSTTLSSRKQSADSTITIHVQQRLHPHDLTSYLLNSGMKFNHICLPAELNQSLQPVELAVHYKDGLFDPIRLSREALAEKLIVYRQKAYNAQMLQQPVDSADAIIQESWLTPMPFSDYQKLIQGTNPVIDFYADTAYTDKTKNDPSAIIAVTKIGEILYILNATRQWMEFTKLIKYIQTWTEANGYTNRSKIYVEPKASGKDVVSYLKTQTPLNIMEGKVPTSSKYERLNTVAPKVEAGKVVLVYGGWNGLLLSEILVDDPQTDDLKDCFTAAIQDKLMKPKNYGRYRYR